ncbi:thiol reductant ABC exporter subunit CydD [Pseudarthrobacter sp. NPDC058362]|uniref:thiol reductant ABC exporter subunit CydD n=1 Tax=Pseudarthrobacter sp. NPDC058362 TaxID=3346458 RepID=UPI00365A6B91
MRPEFPSGPSTRAALYLLGLLAALKALSLVLIGSALAAALAGLSAGDPAWGEGMAAGAAGVVLRSMTVWGQAVAARRAALGVKEELRAQLLERALRNGVRAEGPADGGLAVLATRGLDALDSYYTQFLPALVNCAVVPLLLGVRILFADWLSTVVVMLTVPLVPLFMVLIGRYTEDRVREAQGALARLSAHMLELARGLPVLVGLGRATAQRKALEEISEEYRSRTTGTLRTAFLSALALELIATISVAVVAVFIGVRLVHGDMPLEAGLLALILAPDCYLPLRELGTAHHASDDGRVALAETNAVLDAPEPAPLPVSRAAAAAIHGAANDGGASAGAVGVRGLTVTYGGRAAVGPLSFVAPAGRITALAGPSGAGKSTVLGVLAGTVGQGAGTTVTGALTGLDRSMVAWVPQHPAAVADTVLGEVELYCQGPVAAPAAATTPDAPALPGAGAARECLELAAAGHLAARHPAELSPGELRRVALARGLARVAAGATVLLLDEPTAHLDEASAIAVEEAVARLRGRVTVILVAHEDRTRALADHIVQIAPDAPATTAVPGAAAGAGTHAGLPRPVAAEAATADGTAQTASRRGPDTPGVAVPSAPLRLLAGLVAPVRGRFLAAAVIGTLAAVFAVALSGLSGWLIIRASEQPPILYLLTAIVGVRFFGIGRAVLRYWERLLLHDAVFAALTRLRGRLWESLSRKALAVRRLLQGGNVLGTVIDDVDTVRDLLPRVVLPPVTAVAVTVLAVAATGLLVPAALPAVVAAGGASLLLAPALALWADRASASAEQALRRDVLGRVASALDARADLHVNGVALRVLAGLLRRDRLATAASRRSAWADGLGHAAATAACGTAAFAAAGLAAPGVLAGVTAPATAAVVVLLLPALVEPYAAMTTAVRQMPALSTVLRRIGESGVLGSPAGGRTDEAGGDGSAGDGRVPVPARPGGQAGVELLGLAAAWPGGPDVFSGLDAAGKPGRWLAVTGPSGSGKSTLLSVLLGFLPAAAGAVRATGRVAWCPQEAHLFDSTIRGNLLLGRPQGGSEPAETDMRQALAAVGLTPLVDRLPAGLDTRIGPGGAFLSGGERQRLAVARTLMTGAAVILLDEPTGHLDNESAAAMLADLRSGLRDRTVVLVTHHAADIRPEDARLVLGPGAGNTAAGTTDAGSPRVRAGAGAAAG